MVKRTIMDEIENDLVFHDSMSIYDAAFRDDLLENDALTPEEAAFMRGYDEAA